METLKDFKMNKDCVVSTPKDVILDAVVISVKKTTWANIISADKLSKFDEPNKEIIQIKYETNFGDRIIKGENTLPYYEKPMSNSKLGKYLMKYDTLRVGQKIKVIFNSEGFSEINVN